MMMPEYFFADFLAMILVMNDLLALNDYGQVIAQNFSSCIKPAILI
jgi:hypothetical protein